MEHWRSMRFECWYCKESFPFTRKRLRYTRRETGETVYGCIRCSRHVSWNPAVTDHMAVLGVKRIFVCRICGGFYDSRSRRARHRKIHPQCEGCGERFQSMIQRDEHFEFWCVATMSGEMVRNFDRQVTTIR